MKWSIVLCIILLFTFLGATSADENVTMDKPIELVLVLDDSRSIKDHAFEEMLKVVRDFPVHFPLSENGTRIAVVSFASEALIHLNLTANEQEVKNFTVQRQRKATRMDLALEQTKKVLENARPDAAKIVFLVTDGEPTTKEDWLKPHMVNLTGMAADAVWEQDAIIFVGFVGDIYHIQANLTDLIDNRIARDKSRVLPFTDMDKFKDHIFGLLPKIIICTFNPGCRLDENKACLPEWWRPLHLRNDINCTNKPPNKDPDPCQPENCVKQCEKWPWKTVVCDETNAGQEVTVEREGKIPVQHEAIFENCPKDKLVSCPTMEPQPATTGMGEPKPKTTAGDEESTTGMEAPGVTKEPEPGTTKKEEPGKAEEEDEDKSKSKGGMAGWLIAVIVVVVLLLLMAVVVIAVVMSRRKSKRKAQLAKEKADAKKARTKKASAKKRTDAAASLNLEQSGIGLEFNQSSRKTVEDQIGVSLRETEGRKPGKQLKMSVALKQPSSKSVQPVSSKSKGKK